MLIETTQEYQVQEERLQEIKNLLEEMTKNDNIDLSKVVELRDEARKLAENLKEYLKKTFEKKN